MSGTETLSTSTTSRRTGGGWGSAMTQWASSPPPTWRPSRSSEYNLYGHILRDSLVTIILSLSQFSPTSSSLFTLFIIHCLFCTSLNLHPQYPIVKLYPGVFVMNKQIKLY